MPPLEPSQCQPVDEEREAWEALEIAPGICRIGNQIIVEFVGKPSQVTEVAPRQNNGNMVSGFDQP